MATACDTGPEGRDDLDLEGERGAGEKEEYVAPVYRVGDLARDAASASAAKSTGRFLVVLHEEEVAAESMGIMMSRFSDVRVEETIDSPIIHGFTAPLDEDEIERLRHEPEVAFIEEEQIFTANAVSSWGLDRIDQTNLPLDNTYSVAADGTGVDAYIVDTGIRSTHNEFTGRIGSSHTVINDGNGSDDCNGHGTHVAGTVGGSTYGVATNVTLHAVRVLSCAGSGSTTGIVNALGWVASDASGPAVANMSLGGGASAALDQAVANLVASGVTVVVAAGNENQNACNVSPAREPSAITVGSTTSSDSRSSFSNWGNCVDIFAPGSSITSAWNSSNSSSNTISGTSMASPHTAGVAALYLQGNPGASPAQVANALTGNANSGKVSGTNGSPNLLLNTEFIGGGGGEPPPPPPPPPPGDSCEGACGAQSPDGCWCDDLCTQYGDCCSDYDQVCGEPEPDPNSCAGNCNGQAPGGCWCDSLCQQYGDCCADKVAQCG